jgi:hypothetical protein
MLFPGKTPGEVHSKKKGVVDLLQRLRKSKVTKIKD